MSIKPIDWTLAVSELIAPHVALACHVGPDGDALGSMLALGLVLNEQGVDVVASWGSEPLAPPRLYGFLPGLDLLVPPSEFPDAPETMVTFDAGSFDRLGSLEQNARAAKTLIVIDHHASNDRFGTINLVDPKAAASAVLVHQLLEHLGWEYGADVATCLYAGLVTDTGRFQYANTTPEVHAIAADLLAHGVAHDEISRAIYDTHPLGYLKLAATALGRITVNDGLVWTWVTRDDLAKNAVEMEDIDALIDIVRTADNADVAAVLKQQEDGRYRVSMRSKGATNVGALCESFGGGGHALAAGFTAVNGDAGATADAIARVLRRYAR